MKKFYIWLCVIIVIIVAGCVFGLTCCTRKDDGEEGQSKIMNVSLNPKVEFVLDKDNKVVSVNALNDEGNLIIEGQTFVGKTDEEALKLYIDICKETGFLLSGSLVEDGDNTITIAFSGYDAEQMYNNIKDKVTNYFGTLGITASLQKGADLTSEYLNDVVEDCLSYLSEAEISAMSYQEKVEAIANSRKETCQLFSQELKDLYYQAKAKAVNQAKMDNALQQLNVISADFVGQFTQLYATACDNLITQYNNLFVDDTSAYQVALKAFTEKKTEYLNYKNQVAEAMQENDLTEIAELHGLMTTAEGLLYSAELTLTTAKSTAEATLSTLRTAIDTAYQTVVTELANFDVQLSGVKNMASELQTAITTCKTNFETEYSSAITAASNMWAEMKTDLQNNNAD